jgi:hypothetical protein
MVALRTSLPVSAALLILSVPAAAGSRPAPVASPVVTRVTSLPAGAGAAGSYVVRAVVVNGRSVPVRTVVTAHLLRVGSPPLAVGRAPIRLESGASADVRVQVRLPLLPQGSYALVACVRRPGGGGALGCATAERHVLVGSRTPVALDDPVAPDVGARCSSGAHTLSSPGAHVYPETGNGGYTSVHTGVFLRYDPASNTLLPGTHVVLTDRATQCLTDFSLDFERTSPNTRTGPDMTVGSVLVNGQPATFTFVQPTYPGDPNGQDDPDPRAHQAGQLDPVGGPQDNPFPPACSPELLRPDPALELSLDGTPCPANKLVITPAAPIARGSTFDVEVEYTGRPGVHNDGDGTTEGWFTTRDPADPGSFVTTEPLGTEDWMPLNNHPSAKPTYDFVDTVPSGMTVIANGELVSQQTNPADAAFPGGSTTWHWHSPEGIAAYLVEDSIGNYDLSERLAASGIQYYEAQDLAIKPRRAAPNTKIMDLQEDVVNFQSGFNGPFPFTTDGVVIGTPRAGFEEEMQTKITMSGSRISLDGLNHENMHQWWGDNVSEASYNLTFFKEGLAVLGEFLSDARNAQAAAGGSQAAFEQSLIDSFDSFYASDSLWTAAPSNPRPATLFSGAFTYLRPGLSYIALRRILGPANFAAALQQIQQQYRQGSITEPELEAAFTAHLPEPTSSCAGKLSEFFSEWWDAAYPPGGGANRPALTAQGLDGRGFHC